MNDITHIIQKIEAHKSEQQYSDAIALIEKSIVSYSDDYRLYEELADIYLYKGELDKATKSVDFALELNAKSATGNYLKGFILLSQDKVEQAITFLEISNKLTGNNAEVLRNLGWAYTMIHESKRGICILQRALDLNPDDELITEDLAMALIGIGEITKGNSLLQKIGKKIVK